MRELSEIAVAIAGSLLLLAALILLWWPLMVAAEPTRVTVYKSASCGCCTKWMKHLSDNGFEVVGRNVGDVIPIKLRYGITSELASCHTALVDGYVVEGHVPAEVVKRLLSERPNVMGVSVPGMPIGSPGMEQGARKDPYVIYSFDEYGQRIAYETR